MLKFTGTAILKSPLLIKVGNDVTYPMGRHLRGAIGYIALESNLDIAKLFPDFDTQEIIVRDMIPLDNKFVVEDIISQSYKGKAVMDGGKYRFEVLVDDKYKNDMEVVIKKMRNFNIGSMKSHGLGKFELGSVSIGEVSPMTGEYTLKNDAVIDNGNKRIEISKKIGEDFKKISLSVGNKDKKVKVSQAFGYGKYISLGFGEI